jgi:hypothetical protein
MTAVTPTQPLTTAVLLFGEGQDAGQALAQLLDDSGVLGSLSGVLGQLTQAGLEATDSQVATVAQQLLELDLGDLAVEGWRKHAALSRAAERTKANAGSSEVVELAAHRISSVHKPTVELLLNEAHIATIGFEMRVEFLVQALVATVRHGHIVALGAGACDLTATLAVEGMQLATKQVHLDVPPLIRLPQDLHGHDGSARPVHRPFGALGLLRRPLISPRVGRPRRQLSDRRRRPSRR